MRRAVAVGHDVLPMIPAIHRRVVFFAYPGFDILDLGAAASVFSAASRLRAGAYLQQAVSAEGGPVASSSGIVVSTEPAQLRAVDTMVVLGGALDVVRQPDDAMLRSVSALAEGARRVASTCTGAFILGHAGLLTGRRSTTHWSFTAELQSRFPGSRVQADKIFVNDGRVWTAAGGTAAIDLALALVEEDLGADLARQAAQTLVVYHRRPGGQSQRSPLLDLSPPSDRIRRALSFARDHLHESLTVSRLAEAASLSERQFGRVFLAQTGTTPAKAVERLRADAALPMVEEGRQSLDAIARSVGFSDPEQMRQAFLRNFGKPPNDIRKLHRA